MESSSIVRNKQGVGRLRRRREQRRRKKKRRKKRRRKRRKREEGKRGRKTEVAIAIFPVEVKNAAK